MWSSPNHMPSLGTPTFWRPFGVVVVETISTDVDAAKVRARCHQTNNNNEAAWGKPVRGKVKGRGVDDLWHLIDAGY